MESQFVQDFKAMQFQRKSKIGRGGVYSFNFANIPLPQFPKDLFITDGVPKKPLAYIKGIKEPYFDALNTTNVYLVGRASLTKKIPLSDGTFRKDKDGKLMYKEITVKQDTVAIMSNKSIGLKNIIEINGVEKEHKVSDGFMYVDYKDTPKGRFYIYIVPKKYVYRLDINALIITPNKHRNFFKGAEVELQNGNKLNIYVIPYKYRQTNGYKVIGVKASTNFEKEVKYLLNYWGKNNIIYDLGITALLEPIKGVNNIGLKTLDPTLLNEDYVAYTDSLQDELTDKLLDN